MWWLECWAFAPRYFCRMKASRSARLPSDTQILYLKVAARRTAGEAVLDWESDKLLSIVLKRKWKDPVACSVRGLQEMGKTALFVIFIGDIIICFMLCGRRAGAIIYWSFSFMKFSNGWSGIFLTERLWFLNTSNKIVMSFSSLWSFYCFLSLCCYYLSPTSPPPCNFFFLPLRALLKTSLICFLESALCFW